MTSVIAARCGAAKSQSMPLQDRERNGDDAIGGVDRLTCARLSVDERDSGAAVGAPDGGDLAAQAHGRAEPVRERVRDAIHAADRLEHGGLLGEILLEQHFAPHVGVEQHAQRNRIAPHAGWFAGPGKIL